MSKLSDTEVKFITDAQAEARRYLKNKANNQPVFNHLRSLLVGIDMLIKERGAKSDEVKSS